MNKMKFIKAYSLIIVIGICIILGFIVSGLFIGYQYSQHDLTNGQRIELARFLGEQYLLAQDDFEREQYNNALTRLEYIHQIDANFPGVEEQIAKIKALPSPTPEGLTPSTSTTPTPTKTTLPTQDLRPLEELFTQAKDLAKNKDWQGCIDTIMLIRQVDLNYRVVEIDGLLYASLRYRGVHKIQVDGNLEGGIYDLALAEKIGPLDSIAFGLQTVARLYLYGLSFWDVYPEKAIYYFSQVVAANPSMRDASGWTAAARYQAALLQYASNLKNQGEWCAALSQYELALSSGSDENYISELEYVRNQCSPPTSIPALVTATPVFTEESTQVPGPEDTEIIETVPATIEPPPAATEQPSPEPATELPPVETSISTDSEAPDTQPTQLP
jgi:hypothetical protein